MQAKTDHGGMPWACTVACRRTALHLALHCTVACTWLATGPGALHCGKTDPGPALCHALCRASWTMHHAPCTTHHAPRTSGQDQYAGALLSYHPCQAKTKAAGTAFALLGLD
eukprot:scaffold91276_cov36-Phaeocystis_antarctica.AAC.1